MKKLLQINKITQQQEKGFVTIEILVSLLIALGFVAVSMQSLVYAMAIKVQAQEKQRANQLIQEDIERVNQLGSTALTPAAPAAGDPAPPIPVCNPVDTAADNTTVPPTPAYTAYENSYANALWTAIDDTGIPTKNLLEKIDRTSGSVSTGGKQIALRRFHVSATPGNRNSEAPHRTLKIGYQVWDWNSTDNTYRNENGAALTATDEPIAETYVEIIPDVALQCP